jgi:hypothetical protein
MGRLGKRKRFYVKLRCFTLILQDGAVRCNPVPIFYIKRFGFYWCSRSTRELGVHDTFSWTEILMDTQTF